MATVGLYGSSSSGVVAAATGSESTGLYGNGTTFGGSYFEWFIFQVADTQPATPTGGSWSFSTNSGTPPTGWTVDPPVNPTNTVWVSIALVNSKNASNLTWSEPGKFSFASGLPILSGNGAPQPTDGQSDQLYVQLDTSPQTIWFKESGTWTRLTGSTLYVTASGNQTITGTKTFSSTIQGSVSGTASNVTGTVAIANGGTGATTASGARAALSAAQLGANADITSMTGLTGGISTPDYIDFDTTATPDRATGRLWWDNSDGIQTLNLGMAGSNATLQIGEETYYRIKATSAITEGQVVMFTGTVGASGALTGAPAYALTADTASYLMGIATENIAVNGWGYITAFGLVRGIDTTGGAETWADGDILYYNPLVAGGLTNVVPAAPNAKIQVCAVVHAASNGSLFVRPTYGGKLGQFEGDVQISSPVANNSLFYTGTRWENYAPSAARTALGLGTSAVLNAGVANGVATLDAGGTVPLAQLPASIQGGVSYQGSWNASTNTPTLTSSVGSKGYYYVVSVAGSTNLNGITDWLPGDWAIFNGTAWEKIDNTDAVSSVNGYTGAVSLTYSDVGAPSTTGTNASGTWAIDISGNAATATTSTNVSGGSASVTSLTNSGSTTLTSGTANGVAYLNGSKVLTSGSALTFDGNTFTVTKATAYNTRFAYDSPATYYTDIGYGGTNTVAPSNPFYYWNLNSTEQMRLTSTGLGIGTSSPAQKLDVAGSGQFGTSSTSATVVRYFNQNANLYIGVDSAAGGNTGIANAPYFMGTGAYPMTFWTNTTERMRLDSSGNLGIGTSSPAANSITLARGAGTQASVEIAGNGNTAGSSSLSVIQASDNTAYIYNRANSTMRFGTNNTERMQISADGNLGLDVTPSAWGSSYKAIQIRDKASISQNNSDLLITRNGYNDNAQWLYQTSSYATTYVQNSSGQHVWYQAPSGTAGNAISFTQAMTLDASGNLGVGGTSPATKLDVYGTKTLASDLGVTNIRDTASLASGNGGAIVLMGKYNSGGSYVGGAYVNASKENATDGNYSYALTFGTNVNGGALTERVRIDSSGNVGIGTTSPTTRLSITDSTGPIVRLVRTSNRFELSADNDFMSLNARDSSTYITFRTADTERARIDSSGNFGIGTSSPSAKLHVFKGGVGAGATADSALALQYDGTTTYARHFMDANGHYRIYAPSGGVSGGNLNLWATNSINFSVAGIVTDTPKMTIDSSGNLLVGTTSSANRKFYVAGGVDNTFVASIFHTQSSNPWGLQIQYSAGAPNGTSNDFFYCEDSSAQRMSVRSNGGIANYSANNVNLSDRREKTNFAPAKSYLETICAIPVQTFNYIDQNLEADPGTTLGVVAQDVQAVAPELVMESNWGTEEEPKLRLSIYQTDLQYALMKCIQEQQAIIDSLKARLDAANL